MERGSEAMYGFYEYTNIVAINCKILFDHDQ